MTSTTKDACNACQKIGGTFSVAYSAGQGGYGCSDIGTKNFSQQDCTDVAGTYSDPSKQCSITTNSPSDLIKAMNKDKAYIQQLKDQASCSKNNGYIDNGTGKCKLCADGTTPNSSTQMCDPNPSFGAGNNHGCGVNTFFSWGCTGSGEQITPLIITVLNWLAIGVSIVVVAGIVYGAILYTTSGGNQAQAQKAIGVIRDAVIALILYFAMWALLNFLVPGGLFKP